jgi:hypothetical protein
MKINNSAPTNQPAPAAPPSRLTARPRSSFADRLESQEIQPMAFAEENNPFSDGLNRVPDAPYGQERGGQSFSEQNSGQSSDDSPFDSDTDKADDADKADQAARLAAKSNPLRETGLEREITPPPMRAILHISDLERIVAICRVNETAAGREVTLQLPQSIFSGLKVKISQDSAGRVTTEFLAGQESVRAQIEARAHELAEALRNRGIKLAEVKTSLDSSASGQGDTRRDGSGSQNGRQAFARPNAPSAEAVQTPPASETETANTYFA